MKSVSNKSKKDYIKLLASYKLLMIFIAIVSLMIFLPHFMRDSSLLMGDDSYYHLRIAETIGEKGLIDFDDLSYNGRPYLSPYGWPVSLFLFSKIFGTSLIFTSKLLPFLLGIIFSILFYGILKELKFNKKLIIATVLITIISPIFLYLFVTSNPYSLPLVLNTLVFYLFLKKHYILSSIVLIIVPFFGLFNSIAGIILLFSYIFIKDKKKLKFYIVPIIIALIILAYRYIPFLIKYGLPNTHHIFSYNTLISDLGAKIGISIFVFLLLGLAIIINWKKTYNYILLFFICILLSIISFFYGYFLIYLNFILIILAASALIILFTRKWENKLIRDFTLLVMICGLLFSGLSYAKVLSDLPPSQGMIDSLIFLKERSNNNAVIFSHASNGFWINTIAERRNVMDELYFYAPDLSQIDKDSGELFYTRSLENVTILIKRYAINYLFITKNMKEGLVWNQNEEGLLYLLEYSDMFRRVYVTPDSEVYEVDVNGD